MSASLVSHKGVSQSRVLLVRAMDYVATLWRFFFGEHRAHDAERAHLARPCYDVED